MMYDLEDRSHFEQEYDVHRIVPGSPIKNYIIKTVVLNMIVPEGLRGNAFRDTGEFMKLISVFGPDDYYYIGSQRF